MFPTLWTGVIYNVSNRLDTNDAMWLDFLLFGIRMFGVLFAETISIIWFIIYKKHFTSFLIELQKLEFIFKKLGFPCNMTMSYRKHVVSFLLITVAFIANFLIRRITVFRTVQQIFSYVVPFILSIMVLMFNEFVEILTYQFKTMCTIVSSSKECVYPHRKIEILLQCQDVLESAATQLNKAFSPLLLLLIVITFARATLGIYNFLIISGSKVMDITGTSFMIIVYIAMTINMINIITKLLRESEAFDKAIYSLIVFDDTNTHATNPKLSQYLTGRKKIRFTAFDLFEINFSVLGQMVATGFTYLIIVVQLDAGK
ncbi:putative gustatory receptor 28b [Cimex lectularius]|uniref:Gustatory receptor n=1 Tax=Cimex lectularius TaxID=79782 RepID=A0A8I6RNL9_CIMLE|nr:putative gustatory receptor 28b [Cimex lectularius]